MCEEQKFQAPEGGLTKGMLWQLCTVPTEISLNFLGILAVPG